MPKLAPIRINHNENIESAKAKEQSGFIQQLMDIVPKAASFIPGAPAWLPGAAFGVPFLNLGGGTSTPTAAPSATSMQAALWPGASQGAFGLGAQGAGQTPLQFTQAGMGAINRPGAWWSNPAQKFA